jgi:hypothetical protein
MKIKIVIKYKKKKKIQIKRQKILIIKIIEKQKMNKLQKQIKAIK